MLGHESASPSLSGNHAFIVQQIVGVGHCVGIHPQIHGQLTDGKQLFTWLQPACGYQMPDLLHNLHIDGHAALQVNADVHARIS
jgi:hypothetical protein